MRHGTIPTITTRTTRGLVLKSLRYECVKLVGILGRTAQKPHMASICHVIRERALWTEPARELGAARLVRDVGRQADDREYLRLLHGVFWA